MTRLEMPAPSALMHILLTVTASRDAYVELDADSLRVRLGYTWRVEIPRASITSAALDDTRTISIGAHGWRGEWLVNTSTTGLVVLTIDPAARARCLGFRHSLRTLHVSLADPDGFLAALGAPAPTAA
jgi:hypothetical protein